MKVIDDFRLPEYEFLANYYKCWVEMDGVFYPSVEHAYQASKTFNSNDRNRIRNAASAQEAKRIGRAVDIRQDWDVSSVRINIMKNLLDKKFETSELRNKLLATRNAVLVSGGDTFWGQVDGSGQNVLGQLLMDIRSDLFDSAHNEYHEACKNLLVSTGWIRNMDGDLVFGECWSPPWEPNCQYNVYQAVSVQCESLIPKMNVKNLSDILKDSDDISIAVKDALKTSSVVSVNTGWDDVIED